MQENSVYELPHQASKLSKIALGKYIEHVAILFLKEQTLNQHLSILQQNFRCRQGEIDIILEHNNSLVFVEVRYRRTSLFGGASESIQRNKQKKIIHTAEYFLYQHSKKCPHFSQYLTINACRFDVIAATLIAGKISFEWIQNAFQVY